MLDEPFKSKVRLWSFDFTLFSFAATVVSRSFAVIGFFNFMCWLCHDYPRVGLLNERVVTPKLTQFKSRDSTKSVNESEGPKSLELLGD
jgi:hypothetical protein